MNESLPAPRRLAVIGAGAWGTALALAAGRAPVAPAATTIWAHEADVVQAINTEKTNSLKVVGHELNAEQSDAENVECDIVRVSVAFGG